jgi:DNA-binding NarL/FixJ family response regulator
MHNIINVLIIDDHPAIIDSYKFALERLNSTKSEFYFRIESATTCQEALEKINANPIDKRFDLIFLDIRIPPSDDRKILTGEDLGLKIRAEYDDVKIIVLTSYNDNFLLNNIIKTINPEGFLIKTDFGFDEIVEAIKIVLIDPPYYSRSIIKLLRKQMSNDFTIDSLDRQLLYHLSIGTKTKDLPDVLPLSIAGIERRKRHLKNVLNTGSKDDNVLIQIAKEKGFV